MRTQIAAAGVLALLSLAVGCSEITGPSPTPEQIERLRVDIRERSERQMPIAAALAMPLPIRAPGIKETIVDALGRIGRPAIPSLIESLADPQAPTRIEAAQALARIGPPAADAVPALTTALADGDPDVRLAAARALGQIGPAAAPAIPALLETLRKANEEQRRNTPVSPDRRAT